MSKKLKYVMYNNGPILFGQSSSHSEFRHFNPTSAGFCTINFENYRYSVDVYGGSISLKLKADERDKILIELILNEY